MPLKSLRHPDNPWAWCGTSLAACTACDHKCASMTTLRVVHKYGVHGDDPDHYHNDPMKPSVTGMLGCVRQAALKSTTDYAEIPKGLWPRAWGKARHEIMEGVTPEGTSEIVVSVSVPGGGDLTGTIDYIDDEMIMDYKTATSLRFTTDYQWRQQLSCYRDMVGKPELRLVVAAVAHAGSHDLEVEYDPEALPLALGRAAEYMAVMRGEAGVDSIAPLGRMIKYHGKKTACDFCPYEIRQECERISPAEGE